MDFMKSSKMVKPGPVGQHHTVRAARGSVHGPLLPRRSDPSKLTKTFCVHNICNLLSESKLCAHMYNLKRYSLNKSGGVLYSWETPGC